jgi:hypothetical protein
MGKSKILYAIMSLVACAAVGYFVFIYLAPPEAIPDTPLTVKAPNVNLVNGKQFSSMRENVPLPVKAGAIGWPKPFQPIFDRGIPGIYSNTNAKPITR